MENSIMETIKSHDNFLIVSHINPDGDTIGAALAMALILDQYGKTYQIVNESEIPEKYKFLPLTEQIKMPDQLQEVFSHIITVDCADEQRIGTGVKEKIDCNYQTWINIDHHPTNTDFGTVNLVDPHAASTTVIIYELMKKLELSFDYNISICLYTGLMTDTGSFKYSNTTAKVHMIAADLISYGIDVNDIFDRIYETMSLGKLRFLQSALATINVDQTGKIAWIDLDMQKSSNSIVDDVDGLVDYPRGIEGVEVAIAFKIIETKKIKVSLRSKKYVDVSRIACEFNGGGHRRASGCMLAESLEVARNKIIQSIKKYI